MHLIDFKMLFHFINNFNAAMYSRTRNNSDAELFKKSNDIILRSSDRCTGT